MNSDVTAPVDPDQGVDHKKIVGLYLPVEQNTMKFAALSLAVTLIGATPALAAETLTASFLNADGGVTTGSYDGTVRVTVSGVGQSDATNFNDAFYIYTGVTTPTHDADYYQLSFGTTTLVGFDPAQDAVNAIVGGLPAYSSTHDYTFLLNTGVTSLTQLHFGVSDGIFADNSGAYTITVSAIPESATWAMMLVGFGGLGAAIRARRKPIAA
jgi:hypothetical protein